MGGMGKQNLAVLQDGCNNRRGQARIEELSARRTAADMLCSGEHRCRAAFAAELVGLIPGQQLQCPTGQMEHILIEHIV
ncbi:hypothetical protein D3C81_2222570 [compost metagenome]